MFFIWIKCKGWRWNLFHIVSLDYIEIYLAASYFLPSLLVGSVSVDV